MSLNRDRRQHLVPLAAVQAVGILCGVIGVRWTTTVIPPDLLGAYGLLLSAVQAGLVVTHHGFVKHVQRTWRADVPAGPYMRQLLRVAPQPTLWLTLGSAVIAVALHLLGSVPLQATVLVWIIFANLGVAIAVALQTALQAEERYWANFAVSALGSLTRSFAPPLLVLLIGASLAVVLSAFLLHLLSIIALAMWLLRAAWKRTTPVPTERGSDNLPQLVRSFAAVGLASWIANAASRWFAPTVLSPEGVGYYVLAGNLTLIVPATFGAIALGYTFPAVFAAARDGADDATLWRLTSRPLMTVMAGTQVSLILLWLAAPLLVGLVIDARYAASTEWFLATGGAGLAATSGQFFSNLLLARNREADCIKLSAISCALRLAIMAAGCAAGVAGFRSSLIALPWLTLFVEWCYVRRRLGRQ
ncbi:MAG TPA: hypothetical protein VM029_07155 [Opitutaceae bacterium]|nr:hypothetical protein [Opitutaceae bacterium]